MGFVPADRYIEEPLSLDEGGVWVPIECRVGLVNEIVY